MQKGPDGSLLGKKSEYKIVSFLRRKVIGLRIFLWKQRKTEGNLSYKAKLVKKIHMEIIMKMHFMLMSHLHLP